ncbi:phage baseplate assembly protein V [Arsenophonus sp. PmNCSU2021_1]|uniref:phage baseplate assembly protein V n=1 Tax=Arsenophonus sp. PmNCSU2021_1 TaxID=3118989 RepID=UPI002FEF0F92
MTANLLHRLQNLIRVGVVVKVDSQKGCRVKTGDLVTDWLKWITLRAGQTRTLSAPSKGEQVLIFALGGELTTAFVLTGIFSGAHPVPIPSLTADHRTYADGAVIEYEPATGLLKATGIKQGYIEAKNSLSVNAKQVTVKAAVNIELDTPNVICTHNLTTTSLTVTQGAQMAGDVTHSGGTLMSNGIRVDTHRHGGVERGSAMTEGPQ